MNYRCVVAYGKARIISGPEEKVTALDAITEHILPGRTDEVKSWFEHECDKQSKIPESDLKLNPSTK